MKNEAVEAQIRAAQRGELTEYHIYDRLSKTTSSERIRDILQRISKDELRHYELFREYTGREEKPVRIKIWFFYLVSRIFGLTFGLKLMEQGEDRAQSAYRNIAEEFPVALNIASEEDEHEERLIEMIQEERLGYMDSTIRGLNDALVELTGALAGFTFALQQPQLIAMAGLITGIAGSLSMGVTEFLAKKSEEGSRNPLKSALYTGIAYVITVVLLVLPYLLLENIYISLGIMVVVALFIIMFFNYYLAVIKNVSFRKKFAEMALLSMGIALLSFGIGFAVRLGLGVDI